MKDLCDSFLTDLPEAPTLNFGDDDDSFGIDPSKKPLNMNAQNAQESDHHNEDEDNESMIKDH